MTIRSVPSGLPRCLTMAVAVTTALGALVLGGFFGAQVASAAATAPAATQCDPPAFPTGAGFQVTCTIAINEAVSAAGATSSTVTATACLAAAGVTPPAGCTTTVTTSNQLVTSVDQCNGIVVGGGSNVTCNVSVVDTVPTGAPTPGVTVDQCIGSGTGGGTQPTLLCTPGSTTNATVTQCNGSGNGGGASTRVQCDVIGATTAEPITINQCNGSSNGGGSTVTCATTFANNFVAAAPTTTTTTGAPAGAGGGGGTTTTTIVPTAGAGAAGAAGAGSGVTGLTGSSPGAGGSTGLLTTVVPFGSPETGLGGAAHSRNDGLLWLAAALFAGAGMVGAVGIRRRRSRHVDIATHTL
jgi:hypothetical protein